MRNSIKDNVKPQYFLERISWLLNYSPNTVYCVVEGKSDVALFGKLLTDNVKFDDCFWGNEYRLFKEIFKDGCGKVETLIKMYDHNHDKYNNRHRLIGIRDKDYEEKPACERIFFCDFCCAEMMVIGNVNCFKAICKEFYCNNMLNCYNNNCSSGLHEIRLSCLKHLESLSRLRKYNYDKQCGYNLTILDTKLNYNDDVNEMNDDIIEELKISNNDKDINKLINIFNYCRKKTGDSSLENLLDITNGHDFSKIFVQMCKKYRSGKYRQEDIERGLRISFNKESFRNTNLYNDLKKYQEKNKLRIVD